jgi:hypothetical protein
MDGKSEELGAKPVAVPLCPPQITHGLTRASAVRGRLLTSWAMVRFPPVMPTVLVFVPNFFFHQIDICRGAALTVLSRSFGTRGSMGGVPTRTFVFHDGASSVHWCLSTRFARNVTLTTFRERFRSRAAPCTWEAVSYHCRGCCWCRFPLTAAILRRNYCRTFISRPSSRFCLPTKRRSGEDRSLAICLSSFCGVGRLPMSWTCLLWYAAPVALQRSPVAEWSQTALVS